MEQSDFVDTFDEDFDEDIYESFMEMDRDYKADMDEFDKTMETYEGNDMPC